MPKRDPRRGKIGAWWLTRNRHGVWSRTWWDKSRQHTASTSLGTRDFDEALMLLARWIVLNDRIDHERPADVPLYSVLDRYHAHHAKPNTARGGEASALAIAKLKDFFEPKTTVGDLSLERQRELELWLKSKGYADGYIGRIQSTLSAAVMRSYRAQEIESAPYVRVIGNTQERTRILTPKEAAALFNAGPPDHILMLLLLLFNTLSRPGALLELQPFQIDFEHRLIDLNPPGRAQTKKRRPILPISDTLLPWLQARRKQRYLVQWHEAQARPIGSVKKTWRRLRGDAAKLLKAADPDHPGMDDVIPYTIRHTMATELRRRGCPEWEVAGFLGHRMGRSGTTERYAKFAPDYLSKAATAIDDYMNELQPLVKRELITNVTPLKGRKA
jgi:integrase